jgi:uncharacterized coiled-coil protein SlyX
MKDCLISFSSIIPIIAQAVPTELTSFMPLVEKFGTWIIWFAIALYLFKRAEKKEDKDSEKRDKVDAARQATQDAILETLRIQNTTLTNTSSILVEQTRKMDQMADALRKNPCINFKPES